MEKKNREAQREETRERVYQASLSIFERDGVAQCRVDDIAKEASVSRGTFYFHFPTKEDVLEELLRRSEGDAAKALSGLPVSAPLSEVLEALCGALAAWWRSGPTLFPEVAVVALKLAAKGPTQISLAVRIVLAQRFIAASERGELASEIPAPLLADFFLVNLFAALLAWSNLPGLPLDETLRQVAKLFLQGAASRP